MGPAESNSKHIGQIPCCGMSPKVGFIANTSALVAGKRIEPFVSVPIDIGASPAATATQGPEEEPPVL